MLKQIATVISDANTNIRNMEAKTAEDHATVEIVADIADLKHLRAHRHRRTKNSRRARRAARAEALSSIRPSFFLAYKT